MVLPIFNLAETMRILIILMLASCSTINVQSYRSGAASYTVIADGTRRYASQNELFNAALAAAQRICPGEEPDISNLQFVADDTEQPIIVSTFVGDTRNGSLSFQATCHK